MGDTRRSASHVRRTRKAISKRLRLTMPNFCYDLELEYKAQVFELAFRIACTKTSSEVSEALNKYRKYLADAMDIQNDDMVFATDGSFGVRRTPNLYSKMRRLRSLQDKRFSDIISREIERCLADIEQGDK